MITHRDLRSLLSGEGVPEREALTHADCLFSASIIIEGLDDRMTERVQKEFLLHGGRSVILPGRRRQAHNELLMTGTIEQFRGFCAARGMTEAGTDEPHASIETILPGMRDFRPPSLSYNGKELDFSRRTYIMGILNVTPDSFSDGGRYYSADKAVDRALMMAEEGADIIDIGGESTRPGSDPVPAEIQTERILPVIAEVRKRSNIWISVDTYRSEVARAAIEAGADMINDISGARFDQGMARLAAEKGVPLILMHIKGVPKNMQRAPSYESLMSELLEYFQERMAEVSRSGCAREQILLDPGIGFGKTVEHNLFLLKHLAEFRVLGRPVVVGTSRKSFIGSILNRDTAHRLWGSIATAVLACVSGAHILRVHDVKETRDAVTMARAVHDVEYMP